MTDLANRSMENVGELPDFDEVADLPAGHPENTPEAEARAMQPEIPATLGHIGTYQEVVAPGIVARGDKLSTVRYLTKNTPMQGSVDQGYAHTRQQRFAAVDSHMNRLHNR